MKSCLKKVIKSEVKPRVVCDLNAFLFADPRSVKLVSFAAVFFFWDVTQRSLGGVLCDVQKSAVKETTVKY